MLVIPGRYGKDTCDGFSRRAILRVGSSALAGLSLPTLLQNSARGNNEVSAEEARYGGKGFGTAKSVILLYVNCVILQHLNRILKNISNQINIRIWCYYRLLLNLINLKSKNY